MSSAAGVTAGKAIAEKNRKWVLRSRPTDLVDQANFEWREEAIPAIRDGELLVRNLWLSCDPAQRAWMSVDTFIPAVPIGSVMPSFSAGRVVESKHPGFEPGDDVSAVTGWQDYAVIDGGGFMPAMKIPPGVDLPTALSLFGVTGLAAYFGLREVGPLHAGETVVVSGAAGSTGSIAAQIAKLEGCRVIGIAGGEKKCAWLTGDLGLDAAIDYKKGGISRALRELAPRGVDVYFDNVGGEILDAVLANLAFGARIALCGGISAYNEMKAVRGPKNYLSLIAKNAMMRGFEVFAFAPRFGEAIAELGAWATAGKIKVTVDVVEGLENAPDALRRIFTGQNLGKQLVRIA